MGPNRQAATPCYHETKRSFCEFTGLMGMVSSPTTGTNSEPCFSLIAGSRDDWVRYCRAPLLADESPRPR
jgi:hypothetical protein